MALDLIQARSSCAAVLLTKQAAGPEVRIGNAANASLLRDAEVRDLLGDHRRIVASSQLQRQLRPKASTRSDLALVASQIPFF